MGKMFCHRHCLKKIRSNMLWRALCQMQHYITETITPDNSSEKYFDVLNVEQRIVIIVGKKLAKMYFVVISIFCIVTA